MSNRELLRQLAKSRKVSAGAKQVADDICREAAETNQHGDYRVEESVITIDGLPRIAHLVVDDADGAPGWEFGNSRQKPKRALGRAAARRRG